ncbi:MAG: IclR family transcriptional regulator [Rikenellaceae bacterium]
MKETTPNVEEVKYNVPGLERGIEIIEYLTRYPKGRTLPEIYQALKIPQTTVYRILCTFIRCEYIIYCEDTKRYKLSMKILMLGYRTLMDYSLSESVLPRMRELCDEFHETICFGVMSDNSVVLIEQVQGDNAFCFTMSLGKSFELHCSAPGKAIMAFLPRVESEKYINRVVFTSHNERTITSKEEYRRELDIVLEKGYAIDREEELTGVMCVGAPILNHVGYPCGAIWTSAPKDRIMKRSEEFFVEGIKSLAEQISKDLGYNAK